MDESRRRFVEMTRRLCKLKRPGSSAGKKGSQSHVKVRGHVRAGLVWN